MGCWVLEVKAVVGTVGAALAYANRELRAAADIRGQPQKCCKKIIINIKPYRTVPYSQGCAGENKNKNKNISLTKRVG